MVEASVAAAAVVAVTVDVAAAVAAAAVGHCRGQVGAAWDPRQGQ